MTINRCSLTAENGALVFFSPYDAGLVARLKMAVPASDRQWNRQRKVWMISQAYGSAVVQLVKEIFCESLAVPAVHGILEKTTKILEVRYLGTCKDRGDGKPIAFGYDGFNWSFLFPESVLRDWFETGPAVPDEQSNLYSVLGVHQKATSDEIKSGYRRMALQWHPDVCKEPGSVEQFRRIQHAYEILSLDRTRVRYDAGLQLAGSRPADTQPFAGAYSSYRSPLRCGFIMVRGVETMGRLVVEKILAWEDITRNGQTLIVSWPSGASRPVEVWR
jgi:hypothetical protein